MPLNSTPVAQRIRVDTLPGLDACSGWGGGHGTKPCCASQQLSTAAARAPLRSEQASGCHALFVPPPQPKASAMATLTPRLSISRGGAIQEEALKKKHAGVLASLHAKLEVVEGVLTPEQVRRPCGAPGLAAAASPPPLPPAAHPPACPPRPAGGGAAGVRPGQGRGQPRGLQLLLCRAGRHGRRAGRLLASALQRHRRLRVHLRQVPPRLQASRDWTLGAACRSCDLSGWCA